MSSRDEYMGRDDYMNKVTIGKREPLNEKVILEEFNPNWSVLFEHEADKISSALGNKALQVHHVGSTSVQGLCAKPIIDILLVVANSADELSYIPDLETVGYTLRIREPDWFEHRLLKGSAPDVNMHVFSEGVSEIKRMLTFRDLLRTNENDRRLYESVKRELSQRTWEYIQNYADSKTDVIEDIMRRGLASIDE